MTKAKLIIITLLAAAFTGPVKALDGNWLKGACNAPYGTQDNGVCDGYITGIHEMSTTRLCLPPDVTNTQLMDVVTRYLNGHPERLNKKSRILVQDAIKQAYSCKK
jgi:hypothetical protein